MRTHTRALILGVVAIASVAVAAGVIHATRSPDPPPAFHAEAGAPFPPDAQMLAQLRDISLRIASNTGDSHPTSGRVWATSRSRATMLLDETRADTDQPSYVIVLNGNFAATDAPHPAGAPVPTGSVLTLVLDPSSGEITDFGVHKFSPDMTSVGPGTDLGVSG